MRAIRFSPDFQNHMTVRTFLVSAHLTDASAPSNCPYRPIHTDPAGGGLCSRLTQAIRHCDIMPEQESVQSMLPAADLTSVLTSPMSSTSRISFPSEADIALWAGG
jgi:hypothetical protein